MTPKFVWYTRQNAEQGFSKPDARGQHEPKNKLDGERLQTVLRHINSFPRVAGHYVRKPAKKHTLRTQQTFQS